MKKVLALVTVICLVAAFLVVPAAAEKLPDTEYNLVTSDSEVTKTPVNGIEPEAIFDDNGGLTVKAAGAWPSVNLVYNTPVTFKIAEAKIKVKFTLDGSGTVGTSIRIHTDNDVTEGSKGDIFIHQFLEGVTLDTAGDINVPGTYELEVPFSELAFTVATAETAYAGTAPFNTDELTFTGITIFTINGAEVVIEELSVIVEGGEIVDISDETSEETSETETPSTGDSGIIALAIISVISLAGAVIVKRK